MQTKIDFIEGNTKHCLMAMALPMIAAMFLNMAYNLVDSLWIGNLLGETAYAALTNSTPIILIPNISCNGSDKRHFYFTFTGNRRKKSKTSGEADCHFIYRRDCLFP